MSVLAKEDILARIESRSILIRPFDPKSVGPASIDLRLGRRFEVDVTDNQPVIDLSNPRTNRVRRPIYRRKGQKFILYPGKLVRGMTQERVGLPNDLVGQLGGRSGLARIGLMVELASRIDPGFNAHITLELANHGDRAIAIQPGVRVAALMFHELSRGTEAYKGAYQGITRPEGTRIGLELRREARTKERKRST